MYKSEVNMKNKKIIIEIIIVLVIISLMMLKYQLKNRNLKNSLGDSIDIKNTIEEKKDSYERIIVVDGVTYVDGILLVNKKYSLPETFGNGVNEEAFKWLKLMQSDAKKEGLNLDLISSYRTYSYQKKLYEKYVKTYGQTMADTFSAKPGHSEHQTGLAFDIGKIDDSFGETKAGIWLAKNAHLYGFIIRYPKGKQEITGYKYEPWHVRYLGKDIANKVYKSGLCLEEYLKV